MIKPKLIKTNVRIQYFDGFASTKIYSAARDLAIEQVEPVVVLPIYLILLSESLR